MLNEVKGQNPHEMTLSEIHNTMVQIQMSSTRILLAIDILLRVDDVAEEMEDDLPDEEGHPLQSLAHIPNVGPVELRRAADLIKELGYKSPEDIDGNRPEIGDMVGFTIAGPDANNYLQGKVCRRNDEYWVYCGTPGLIKIDSDLLNLHLLPNNEPGLKSPECSVCDEPADDRAQTRNVMGRNDSIWICSHCLTLISDYRYQHLNPDGCCPECETQLIQYSRVIWSP